MKITNFLMACTALSAVSTPLWGQTMPGAQSGPVAQSGAPGSGLETSPPDNRANETGEIIVTARRVAENLQNIPLAVSALGAAELDRRSIGEIMDLSATVPNLNITNGNNGGSQAVIQIRGQIQSSSGLIYIDPAVGVYVDGLNNPRNFGLRSGLVDVQRVEVLRGPQGTLYGRNTTGGAVSIYTQDPIFGQTSGNFESGLGNYDARHVEGVLNVPLGADAGLRVVGVYDRHGPYGRQTATGRGLMNERNGYARAKFKYRSGDFTASITGDYFDYRSSGANIKLTGLVSGNVATVDAGTIPVLGGAAARYAGCYNMGLATANPLCQTRAAVQAGSAYLQQFVRKGPNAVSGIDFYDSFGTAAGFYGSTPNSTQSDSNGGSVAVTLDYKIDRNITVRSISGWRTYKRNEPNDYDGTPLPIFGSSQHTSYQNFYSEELQLLGDIGPFEWVLGGFYSYEKGLDDTPSFTAPPPGSTAFTLVDARSINISKAIFGQASYHVTDRLTVTGGARYTRDIRKIRSRNRNSAGTCFLPPVFLTTPGTCEADFKAGFDYPSWLVSLDYKVTDTILGYVKFSRGSRSGGLQGRASAPTVPDAFVPFKPEALSEYEVGLKNELFDRRLRLNLAFYYDRFSNIQRNLNFVSGSGTPYSVIANAASADLYGIEAEAGWRVTPELTVSGNVGTLHARYNSFVDPVLGDLSDQAWPAPKLVYSIGAAYGRPVEWGGVSASLNWDYKARINFQPQARARDQVSQSGYGVLNGRLGATIDAVDVDISLFGRNLLQKRYYQAGISIEALGFNTLTTGEPRTFGIQIKKRFGGA